MRPGFRTVPSEAHLLALTPGTAPPVTNRVGLRDRQSVAELTVMKLAVPSWAVSPSCVSLSGEASSGGVSLGTGCVWDEDVAGVREQGSRSPRINRYWPAVWL